MKFRLLALLVFCTQPLLAQRYGIGSSEGIRGLKIFGGIILVVAAITVVLYIRRRGQR
jgi:hypothetical protein